MQQCESEEKREKMAEIVKSKEENPQINLHIQRERRDFASFIVIYYIGIQRFGVKRESDHSKSSFCTSPQTRP